MPDKFTYVKRGYDPDEVEKYIETLEAVIKSYKDKDNAIKNAIISAQLAADNIVKNAQIQCDEIRMQTVRQLDGITNSISTQKIMIKEFQEDYNSFVRKYVQEFNDREITRLYSKLSDMEEFVNKLHSSNFAFQKDTAEPKQETTPAPTASDGGEEKQN